MIYENYIDRLYRLALKNRHKTSKQIAEEIKLKRDGILEELCSNSTVTAEEYIRIYNNKDKILNEIIEKIEYDKFKEALEEEVRKDQEKEEKELRKKALEELKEEERKKQDKRVKIACIIASIFYIITILYTLLNY